MKYKAGDFIVLAKCKTLDKYLSAVKNINKVSAKYNTIYKIKTIARQYYVISICNFDHLFKENEVQSAKEYKFNNFMKGELS